MYFTRNVHETLPNRQGAPRDTGNKGNFFSFWIRCTCWKERKDSRVKVKKRKYFWWSSFMASKTKNRTAVRKVNANLERENVAASFWKTALRRTDEDTWLMWCDDVWRRIRWMKVRICLKKKVDLENFKVRKQTVGMRLFWSKIEQCGDYPKLRFSTLTVIFSGLGNSSDKKNSCQLTFSKKEHRFKPMPPTINRLAGYSFSPSLWWNGSLHCCQSICHFELYRVFVSHLFFLLLNSLIFYF